MNVIIIIIMECSTKGAKGNKNILTDDDHVDITLGQSLLQCTCNLDNQTTYRGRSLAHDHKIDLAREIRN